MSARNSALIFHRVGEKFDLLVAQNEKSEDEESHNDSSYWDHEGVDWISGQCNQQSVRSFIWWTIKLIQNLAELSNFNFLSGYKVCSYTHKHTFAMIIRPEQCFAMKSEICTFANNHSSSVPSLSHLPVALSDFPSCCCDNRENESAFS